MEVLHSRILPPSGMALAICSAVSWRIRQVKVIQVSSHRPKTSNNKVLRHTRCLSHHQCFTNRNFQATNSHRALTAVSVASGSHICLDICLEINLLITGYNPQPPQSTASPGPGKGRNNRGPPGPTTPHQSQPIPYPDSRPSPQMGRQASPPQQQIPNVGNMLADLDPDSLPSHQKREGVDWFAVFNPRVRRVLDVDLVHNLSHESVVCCVRFSHDGRYVATGCNRSAQIFEVSTGNQVTKLQDESVDKDGDLYIRSVCFSPDGKYLATGAEDKQIRVSH